MNEIIKKFTAMSNDPYSTVKQWKEKTGKKVIGVSPMHVPEEIIHAAGMLPVIFWPSDEPITLGNSFTQPTICGYPRSVFDDALKGKLKFLDGGAYCDCCLAQRQFQFVMNYHVKLPFYFLLYLPQLLDEPLCKGHMVLQLRLMRDALEKFSGQKISDEQIRQSIVIFNKHRSLMRKLYDFRRINPGVLRAREVLAVVQSGLLMPKEEHSKMVEELLASLEKEKKPSVDGKARVVISGSMCQAPRLDVLNAIEDAGGVIVDDDLWMGARYSITDAPETGDPFEALADRFLGMKLRCPSKSQDSTDWAKQLAEIAKKNKAQGVVSLEVKFCEPHYFYYSHIMQTLDKQNIRNLGIEMEHETTSSASAQIATRVQAFIESCKGGK